MESRAKGTSLGHQRLGEAWVFRVRPLGPSESGDMNSGIVVVLGVSIGQRGV